MDRETLDVWRWDDDEQDCGACGDPIKPGHRFAKEPETYVLNGKQRQGYVAVHDWCAVRNGFLLRESP